MTITVRELLTGHERLGHFVKGRLIALDAANGKILFDTRQHKSDYIAKFNNGIVLCIFADAKKRNGHGFGDFFEPVISCYVSNESWLREV